MRWALVALMACAPAPPPVQGPPAAPVLEEPPGVQRRSLFTLRGEASDEVVVRLFADAACAGPVYLQITGAELKAGVDVQLVPGADNLFSANAVSSRGVTSQCSSPVRLRYVAAVRPGRPSVDVQPMSPSRSLSFVVKGAADVVSRVRLHENFCGAPVLAELSAEEFFDPGFPVELRANERRTLAVDAVDQDMISDCATVTLNNDLIPPLIFARLASPTPSPQRAAWIALSAYSGELNGVEVIMGPDCNGPTLNVCLSQCSSIQLLFPPDASTTFSVLGSDRVGNTACAQVARPWVHDPSLPEEETVVLSPRASVGTFVAIAAEVPATRRVVQLFHSADCSGPVTVEQQAYSLVQYGVYMNEPFGGFVTARSVREDGGVDPCSNAVPWE